MAGLHPRHAKRRLLQLDRGAGELGHFHALAREMVFRPLLGNLELLARKRAGPPGGPWRWRGRTQVMLLRLFVVRPVKAIKIRHCVTGQDNVLRLATWFHQPAVASLMRGALPKPVFGGASDAVPG